jgi:hypothetical protein
MLFEEMTLNKVTSVAYLQYEVHSGTEVPFQF